MGLSGMGYQSVSGVRRESMRGKKVAAYLVIGSLREVKRFPDDGGDGDRSDLA